MNTISVLLIWFMASSTFFIQNGWSECIRCSEPHGIVDTGIEYMINKTRIQSYSITPGWQYNLEHAERVPSKLIDIKLEHFHGDMNCPVGKKINDRRSSTSRNKKRHTENDNTLDKVANCPWRFVENIDINRKPDRFLEVKCLCTHPVQPENKHGLVCNSVIEYVSVLRRTGYDNSVWTYQQAWEPRTVACVASSLPEPEKIDKVAFRML